MQKKRIVSLLLVFALLFATLAGCGSEGDTAGGKENDVADSAGEEHISDAGAGRFMESKVTLPAEVNRIEALRRLEDGSLQAIGTSRDGEKNIYYMLNSSDYGANWTVSQIQGLEQDYYPKMAIAPDGSAVLVPYTKDCIVDLRICDRQGATSPASVSIPEMEDGDPDNHIWQAEYDSQGNLIVMDSDHAMYAVDPAGGSCKEIFDTQGIRVEYFGLTGTKCIAIHQDGVLVFDTVTGEPGDTETVISDMIKENQMLTSVNTDTGYPMVFCEGTEENTALYVNEKGLYHYTMGGSVSEQLMDGGLMSVGTGSAIFYAICAMDGEHIFVSANDGENANLLLYTYNSAAASAPDSEITVYALEESDTLRYAVSVFQGEHPEIYVNLKIGMSGEDGITREDALSVLNTDMMAEKGPDVLILDGMPVDSYIEKGILTDISDVVNEVAQTDGLFANIVEASTVDGHIYGMPTRFLLSLVESDADSVAASATLKGLADRAEELKGQTDTEYVMQPRAAEHLMRELFYADSASWKQEDGSLDEEKLKDFLTQAKRIYDVDQYEEEARRGSDRIDGLATVIGTLNSSGMIDGTHQIGFGTLADIEIYQLMRGADAVTGAIYDITNRDQTASYIPFLTAGVTAGGQEDMAKEFVKTLLGKEAGTASNGIPVNRAAFAGQIEKTNNNLGMSVGFSTAGSDEHYSVEYVELTEEDVQTLTGMIESLTAPALTDATIQNLVVEQGCAYLTGEQSLETALDTIMKKVNLYLAE